METADILIEKGKIEFGLFFCHLAIEKILKAHYIRYTEKLAPKTHDLYYLLSKCDFTLSDSQYSFLKILMRYQMEWRYPEQQPLSPSKSEAIDYLITTKDILEWLLLKL